MDENKKEEAGAVKNKIPQPTFPLFFSNPVPLEPGRHGNAGIRIDLPPVFAGATNSIPLTIGEFVEAAKYYPIVFTGEDPVAPALIVGIEQENDCIGKDGKWLADMYVPAYVRKYPFIFLQTGNEQFTLCIDEQASAYVTVAEKEDQKFFEGTMPTEFTRNALKFCTAFQEEYTITRRFCDELKALDLLMPGRSDAQLVSGRTIRLSGFQLIDQKKFAQLPDNTILRLHKEGFLPLIYYALMSNSNWKSLVDKAALREVIASAA